jgi:predicted TIM-barrel fold metal-dependent hydrolase
MKIIDADGHITESEQDIKKYLPEPYCLRSGTLVPSIGADARMAGRFSGIACRDTPTRLRDMDKEGIDVSVLFPTSSFAFTKLFEQDYAVAYARAYNDFIADVCRQSSRIKAAGLVPFQDVDAAVKEVNRAITELGLAGIAVASQGMKEHLGSKTFWPIYEEIQRLDVPFCVHNRREGPPGENRFDSFICMHTIGRPAETIMQFVGLTYGGIPERFPKLRVAFLECGTGWVPYWLERMDEEWEKRGKVETPFCKQKPSEYISHGNWFFATEPEEEMLPYVIERIGEDKIIFGSDYPHWDSMFPNVVSTIRGRKDISETTKEKILEKNPSRLYGFA